MQQASGEVIEEVLDKGVLGAETFRRHVDLDGTEVFKEGDGSQLREYHCRDTFKCSVHAYMRI